MFRKTLLTILMAGAASVAALPTYAQSEGGSGGRQDVAVQGFGSFVTSTTQNGIENKATNSGGVLTSYRFFFSKHSGIEANYGYAESTQKYTGAEGVKTRSHEISGAYVFHMPLRKFTPFALAGAGALVFDPKNYVDASTQTRPAFIYGGGLDYNLSHRIFLRAEYRGFVYNSPTYSLAPLTGMDRIAHRAEPSIGFGYRF